jgi:hypothetical protein
MTYRLRTGETIRTGPTCTRTPSWAHSGLRIPLTRTEAARILWTNRRNIRTRTK